MLTVIKELAARSPKSSIASVSIAKARVSANLIAGRLEPQPFRLARSVLR